MNDLEYDFDKHLTSEAAELASMSVMFALDQYDTFSNRKKTDTMPFITFWKM
ncbi:MAG: hypothetical protein R2728_13475 [Chitinophagales bacterium]